MARVPDRDPIFWRITLPLAPAQTTAAKVEFAALVEAVGLPFEEDNKRVVAKVKLAVSGAVTYTPGS